LDIDKFVQTLNHNAHRTSGGECGRYIWLALQAGGLGQVGSHNGKDYGPYLLKNGFSAVPTTGYQPKAGDVVVIQPYPGGNAAGHVEAWNGSQFVSDFFQNYYPKTPGGGVYPGPGYRKHQPPFTPYRPSPCPTSSPAEETLLHELIGLVGGLFN
jgi:type VI secretion system secreted protein VgrG